ncbi:MAG: hypothetical protein AAF823_03260 [Planctomycetota bacterium]
MLATPLILTPVGYAAWYIYVGQDAARQRALTALTSTNPVAQARSAAAAGDYQRYVVRYPGGWVAAHDLEPLSRDGQTLPHKTIFVFDEAGITSTQRTLNEEAISFARAYNHEVRRLEP